MILKNRNAVIYGGGGSLGGAVAKALAQEGAHVFLTGRTMASLKKVQDEIISNGGNATVAVVDALDQSAVIEHLREMSQSVGSVDITFNAIDTKDTQDKSLVEMALEDFIRPIHIAMTTQFITTTAAAHLMKKQRRGVILSLTATPGGIGYPGVGGFGPMCAAVESLSRNLAAELGPYGIRVVNIRSGGSPDSKPFTDAIQHLGDVARKIINRLEGDTMLKTLPLMEDIGNVAAFLASDKAGKITGVTIDVTCGTTSAINHRTDTIPFGSF
jgi:3-oxoacyl-[acyl-carrier protein] reductase